MTAPLTKALRQLLDKATRRPWSVTRGVVPSIDGVERVIVEAVHRSTKAGGWVVANCGPVGEYGSGNDADLIAEAINNLPALLDAADAADAVKAENGTARRVASLAHSIIVAFRQAFGDQIENGSPLYKKLTAYDAALNPEPKP